MAINAIFWTLLILAGAGIGYAAHAGSIPWVLGTFACLWYFLGLVSRAREAAIVGTTHPATQHRRYHLAVLVWSLVAVTGIILAWSSHLRSAPMALFTYASFWFLMWLIGHAAEK